jgi:hypothetical protein
MSLIVVAEKTHSREKLMDVRLRANPTSSPVIALFRSRFSVRPAPDHGSDPDRNTDRSHRNGHTVTPSASAPIDGEPTVSGAANGIGQSRDPGALVIVPGSKLWR